MEKLLSQNLEIPDAIMTKLPPKVKLQLNTLHGARKGDFLDIYLKHSKSLPMAYLLLIFIFPFHYAYQDRWSLQVIFWLTAGGFLVWWLIDFFRLPGMIRHYNEGVGRKALKIVEEGY